MLGLMQDRPLLISQIIDFAEEVLPRRRDREPGWSRGRSIATATRTRRSAPSSWPRPCRGSASSSAIQWAPSRGNTYRHFELYFGISGIRRRAAHESTRGWRPSTSPISPTHAEDKAIFVDLNLLPIVEGVWPHLKTVKHVVVMTDRAHMPATSKIPNLLCYEELIADKPGTNDVA